jgi:hypothetical protein
LLSRHPALLLLQGAPFLPHLDVDGHGALASCMMYLTDIKEHGQVHPDVMMMSKATTFFTEVETATYLLQATEEGTAFMATKIEILSVAVAAEVIANLAKDAETMTEVKEETTTNHALKPSVM